MSAFVSLTAQEISNRQWALIEAYQKETGEIVARRNPAEAHRLAFLWREVDVMRELHYMRGTDDLYTYNERLAQAKQLLN